jgi:hypothetical protein
LAPRKNSTAHPLMGGTVVQYGNTPENPIVWRGFVDTRGL